MVIKTRQLVDLINGQWFANRACAYRDGAHGEMEAGVCGEKGEGAYSIVLANAGYADEDHGEVSFFSYEYHDCLNLFNRQSYITAQKARTRPLLTALNFCLILTVSSSQFAFSERNRSPSLLQRKEFVMTDYTRL